MHVDNIRNINRQLIKEENTFLRLARRNLKVETESEIMRHYVSNIMHKNLKKKHRKYYDEAIYYTLSAFPILVKEHYVRRHDRLCAQLHFKYMKRYRALAWACNRISRNKS
jgi:hypothetical protein